MGFDLRGHGHSEGKRGNGNYEDYLNDIETVYKWLKLRYGNLPRVLYGHSMGGNLALGYAINCKPDIDRLIVTSPWLKLTKPPMVPLVIFAKLAVKFFLL
ncbi:MAG: alpha/beta hydrolase [Bacteroidales bacterium]|nr:alpha/beta hydrolase [Bacteroidales bacterium]